MIFSGFFERGVGHSPAPTYGCLRHEADLLFLAIRKSVVPFSIGDVVAVLHGHDRHSLARALNLLGDTSDNPM